MAHFAKIGLNNKVINVVAVDNRNLEDSNGIEQEQNGINFLESITGWSLWVQTSYNTIKGIHKLNGTPLRKNYAGIGYTYDEDRNAFIPKKPFNSWLLNETTCQWEAPVAKPNNNNLYTWNETTTNWDIVE
tara:strand:- start:325 stop:717 length:393 start_codon:yes stop_codon:yes gene_type:complete